MLQAAVVNGTGCAGAGFDLVFIVDVIQTLLLLDLCNSLVFFIFALLFDLDWAQFVSDPHCTCD